VHQDAEEQQLLDKLESARKLVLHLKILFGQMTKSYKKYADPTQVLKSLTDDQGKPVEIGEEKDIGEFNDTFLSRVQEGLNYKQIYKDFVNEKRQKALLARKQRNMMGGEENKDVVRSKQPAEQLGLKTMNSSINVDDNELAEPSPKVDSDALMKDETQIIEKEQIIE